MAGKALHRRTQSLGGFLEVPLGEEAEADPVEGGRFEVAFGVVGQDFRVRGPGLGVLALLFVDPADGVVGVVRNSGFGIGLDGICVGLQRFVVVFLLVQSLAQPVVGLGPER